jgi:hypothetical protein
MGINFDLNKAAFDLSRGYSQAQKASVLSD